jgi:hypothetical protein
LPARYIPKDGSKVDQLVTVQRQSRPIQHKINRLNNLMRMAFATLTGHNFNRHNMLVTQKLNRAPVACFNRCERHIGSMLPARQFIVNMLATKQ